MALTKKQTLILWALLIRPGGMAMAKDIKPLVEKADRDALQSAGLVTVAKGQRNAKVLEVTERGWGYAAEHLDADLPGNSPAGSLILQGWLKLLKAFLGARGLALADFVTPRLAPTDAPSPIDAEIDARIRAAYLACTGGALNQRVFLSRLRERLPDVRRAELDEALRALHLSGRAELSGTDNPFELTPSDREGGLAFKGEEKYVLWIVA